MVKFLVESGACLFASTLSDLETPAEKCEEDEEGFDGCSEYLYSNHLFIWCIYFHFVGLHLYIEFNTLPFFVHFTGIQEKLGILNSGEVYAVFSYSAQQSDELSFEVNDHLTILRKGDDTEREWWWAKSRDNMEGYVPRNLLGVSKNTHRNYMNHYTFECFLSLIDRIPISIYSVVSENTVSTTSRVTFSENNVDALLATWWVHANLI